MTQNNQCIVQHDSTAKPLQLRKGRVPITSELSHELSDISHKSLWFPLGAWTPEPARLASYTLGKP